MKLLIGLLAVSLYAQAPLPGALNGTGGGGGGGATAPATPLVYKGDNTLNGIVPATPDTDYASYGGNNALIHGNAVTNSIDRTIIFCGSNPCSIIIPPTYATTEHVPGQYFTEYGGTNGGAGSPYGNPLTGATTAATIGITDQRFRDWQVYTNAAGAGADSAISKLWNFNWTTRDVSQRGTIQNHLGGVALVGSAYDGGYSYCNPSVYCDKTTHSPLQFRMNSWTDGQHFGYLSSSYGYGNGDLIGGVARQTSFGGIASGADEGVEWFDLENFQGYVDYLGTLTGSPTTGATNVTVSPSQGSGTQGSGRFLLNTTSGKVTTAGTISAITSPGSALTTFTGSGTSWVASTVVGSLGTNVNAPGSATVTPSFTTGTIAGITTSTLVCVADSLAIEAVIPSTVGASTFTATYVYPHLSTASIGVGGEACKGVELTADEVTNSTFATKIQAITGTLKIVWPVAYAASSTSLKVWVTSKGNWDSIPTRWDASTANGYALYPMAFVASVQQGGGVSNTLTLQANNVAWSASDNVEEVMYPAFQSSNGQWIHEKYFPSMGGAASGGSIVYNGLWNGNDCLWCLTNNTPASFYQPSGGKYTAPYAFSFRGPQSYGLYLDTASDQAAVAIGCNVLGCAQNTAENVIRIAYGASSFDLFKYNPSTQTWFLSAGGITNFSASPSGVTLVGATLNGTNTFVNGDILPYGIRGGSNSPAISGCSATIGTGSTNISGFYTSGTTGTCAVTLTWANSISYSHGANCMVRDDTTVVDQQNQNTTDASTTVSFTGTTVTGDKIRYSCIGF